MTEPKWNKFEAFALESRMRLKGSSFRGRKIKFQLFPRWKLNDVIGSMLVLKVIKQFKVNWFVDELLQKKDFWTSMKLVDLGCQQSCCTPTLLNIHALGQFAGNQNIGF